MEDTSLNFQGNQVEKSKLGSPLANWLVASWEFQETYFMKKVGYHELTDFFLTKAFYAGLTELLHCDY